GSEQDTNPAVRSALPGDDPAADQRPAGCEVADGRSKLARVVGDHLGADAERKRGGHQREPQSPIGSRQTSPHESGQGGTRQLVLRDKAGRATGFEPTAKRRLAAARREDDNRSALAVRKPLAHGAP